MARPIKILPATEGEIRTILRAKINDAGSMRSAAKRLGITAAYLCDIVHGRRAPGPRVAKALGFRREVHVVRTALFHLLEDRTNGR